MKRKWTIEEDNFLRDNYKELGLDFCASKLGRTVHGVASRVTRLNLINKQYHVWTNEKDQFLIQNYSNLGRQECAKILKLSINIIKIRARQLKLIYKKDWKIEDVDFLIENYPKNGYDYCAEKLNRSRKSIEHKVSLLRLKRDDRINPDKIEFLKKNYPDKGSKFCAEKLNKTEEQIIMWCSNLKIKRDIYWDEEEIQYLRDNYSKYGAPYCSEKLNRPICSIHTRAMENNISRWVEKEGYKTCSHCKTEKLLNEFQSSNLGRLGVASRCKKCNGKISNQRKKDRRKVDMGFRILMNMRSRIQSAIKHNKKSQRTMELVGCSIEFLRQYLEKKFLFGMSWENYGFGDDKWHVDHIIPCSYFDFTIPENQKKCFHYTNLQPLWQHDNLTKHAKLNWRTNP